MTVLDSITVLEIGGLGPGPFCAMHLADLGADVISIVREEKQAAPTGTLLNRGKRSVFADLKTPEGKALVLALVQSADVLIEGMRPGVMERLGLGPTECMAANPRLVYGRMTGWGQSGPLSPRAGHDNNYAALSGALWGCSPADARPVSSFAMVGDIGGGALYLMTGLLAGIINARQTGEGTVVDAAIVDGAAHMLNLALSARQRGVVTDTRGTSIHDSAPFYETYVCADGAHITIGSIEPQFYTLLLQTLGLAGDGDFATAQWDKAAWPRRRARLQAIFITFQIIMGATQTLLLTCLQRQRCRKFEVFCRVHGAARRHQGLRWHGGKAVGKNFHFRPKGRVRHAAPDEPNALCLCSGQFVTQQGQAQCTLAAHQSRQQPGAAAVRQQANLGKGLDEIG